MDRRRQYVFVWNAFGVRILIEAVFALRLPSAEKIIDIETVHVGNGAAHIGDRDQFRSRFRHELDKF